MTVSSIQGFQSDISGIICAGTLSYFKLERSNTNNFNMKDNIGINIHILNGEFETNNSQKVCTAHFTFML
jgi:hypothetical protein